MEGRDYSVEALLRFLEYASETDLLKFHTARTRKTAIKRLMEVFDDDEKNDVRNIDLNEIIRRFTNKAKNKVVNKASLRTYEVRLKRSIEDFLSWITNPSDFKARTKGEPQLEKDKDLNKEIRIRVPVPIRGGVVVYIDNLPEDITKEEADKLIGVINALAAKKN